MDINKMIALERESRLAMEARDRAKLEQVKAEADNILLVAKIVFTMAASLVIGFVGGVMMWG